LESIEVGYASACGGFGAVEFAFLVDSESKISIRAQFDQFTCYNEVYVEMFKVHKCEKGELIVIFLSTSR
jgi:hypothetical protein